MEAYYPQIPTTTQLSINTTYVAERLEEKIERIMNNKEPITDGAPQIYTERKDGVMPAYNIRTDRWDIALEATESIAKGHQAKRMEAIEKRTPKKQPNPETGDNTSNSAK